MASIIKRGGVWRAEVARRGVRKSATFPTKSAAKDWAAHQEHLILNAVALQSSQPFGEVMARYAREVSPAKRGARWEQIRIEAFKRSGIAKIGIGDLKASDFAAWREARLREVSVGTVKREMVLLSAILTVARKEWGLIRESPMVDVRKPSSPPARDRLATDDELARLLVSAGTDLTNATARAHHAFLFAVETAMRAGEITGLTWDRVDLASRVVQLPLTKNGFARSVPLSSEAVRLLQALPYADPVFGLTDRQRDALWRKARDRAGVVGLHFHDSRGMAVTRLARKVDVLTLSRITGHRNISMLTVYYRESAADLAKRLG